ncbi:ATP-grasp domain-containing protein [bacterium]|nr:ATP-grasp domain-containing protein [bacterium]
MKILFIGNNHATRVFSKKFAEYNQAEIYSTTNVEGVNFIDINYLDFNSLLQFVKKNKIELVIISDYMALESDFSEKLKNEGIGVFAPDYEINRITSDKAKAKKFLYRNKIETTPFVICDKSQNAYEYIKNADYPLCIKPNEHNEILGTVICETYKEAHLALTKFYENDFSTIIFENFIEGQEFTAYIITDGFNAKLLNFVSTKNSRWAKSGINFANEEFRKKITEEYINPLMFALSNEGEYIGIIGIDFLLDSENNLFVLECNPFFQSLDVEIFTKSCRENLIELFESALSGDLVEKYQNVEFDDMVYLAEINNSGEVETHCGRTLHEALEISESKELQKEFEWKF